MEEEREWKAGRMQTEEAGNGDESSSDDQVDKLQVYKSILEILKPGETVTKVNNYYKHLRSYYL